MTARVVLHPGPDESAADLCRDLIAISDRPGAVRSTGGRGFAVDPEVALLYLTYSTRPAEAAPPPPAPDPAPEPGDAAPTAADAPPDTTTPPPGTAPAEAPVRPRRVPTRKAAMRGNPDGE